MSKQTVTALVAACLLVLTATASAEIGIDFTYQGYLEADGVPAQIPDANIVFYLYDAAIGGTALAGEGHPDVEVVDGVFTVVLSFYGHDFDGGDRWLEIVIEGTTLTPRQKIRPVPYAMTASSLETPAELSSDETDPALSITNSSGYALEAVTGQSGDGAWAVHGSNALSNTIGMLGGAMSGVRGYAYHNYAAGVTGKAVLSSGQAYGVQGTCDSPDGYGAWGSNTDSGNWGALGSGTCGVRGTAASTSDWAGYFDGRGHFSGQVTVGDSNPPPARNLLAVKGGSSGETYLAVERGLDELSGINWREDGVRQWIFPFFRGWQSDNLIVRDEANLRDVMTFEAATGDVGVGISDPEVPLHVSGGGDASPSGGGYLVLGGTAGANLAFDNNEIMARNDGATSSLLLNADGGDVLICRDGGQVGIGTSAPGGVFHARGGDSGGSAWYGEFDFIFENDNHAALNVVATETANSDIIFSDTTRGRGAIQYKHATDSMEFRTAGTGPRLLIDASGNVGIGTASPSAKLDVYNTGVTPGRAIRAVHESSVIDHSIEAVYGEANGSFGENHGVYGTASGANGATNYGVYGTADDYGVYGTSFANGVYGHSDSFGGIGVHGVSDGIGGKFERPYWDPGYGTPVEGWAELGTFRNAGEDGWYGWGVMAEGSYAGGEFSSTTSSAYSRVGYASYKIRGSGSVAFVQNHPTDDDHVIVYNSPEGDEVATYTRGTSRLVDGRARVPLGETFQWVTNPDIGLTAHLTPRGSWADLYVESISTTELVVASPDSSSDARFDYIVYGLRIGFEEVSTVQAKTREAYIPSMASHRELYAAEPELRQYNALERFKRMGQSAGLSADPDLSRAQALRSAIVEFDPEIHAAPNAGPAPQAAPEDQLPVEMPATELVEPTEGGVR